MFAIVFLWRGISEAFSFKLIEKYQQNLVFNKLIYRLSISVLAKKFPKYRYRHEKVTLIEL